VILQQIREEDRTTLHREAIAGDWHPRNQAVRRIVSGEDRTYQTENNPQKTICVTVWEPSATCAQELFPCVSFIPVTKWPQKACRTTCGETRWYVFQILFLRIAPMIVSCVFLGIVLLSRQDDPWDSSWNRTSWAPGQSGGRVPDQMKEVLQHIFWAIRLHFRNILP